MNKPRLRLIHIIRAGLAGLIAVLLAFSISCHHQKESQTEMPTRDINAVMADHTAELMALPGVTGVAIGELDDKTPCILVLIKEETKEITRNIPTVIEGHPVRLMVTGVIKPMDSD